MSWQGRPPRWHPLRSPPTRFALIKVMVLLFFVVIFLAPLTGWLMSMPMWLMDFIGYLVSTSRHSPSERWFRGALTVGGAVCTIAVLWRAREDGDDDLTKRAVIAATILAVYLAATYPASRGSPPQRAERAAAARIQPTSASASTPSRTSRAANAPNTAPAKWGEPPPPLPAADYDALAERLVRGAARSAAGGDPFFRQQLAMLGELRKERAPADADGARYETAMQRYRRVAQAAVAMRPVGEKVPAERYLQAARSADPNSAMAARELGAWRLRAYMRQVQRDADGAPEQADNLREASAAARAMFVDALRMNPSFDGAWRGLAWTWLYDDPDLAQGALTIEADQRFDASGAKSVLASIEAAADAAGAPGRLRFEVLEARARATAMDLRNLSVPRDIQEVARLPFPMAGGQATRTAAAAAKKADAKRGVSRAGAIDRIEWAWRSGALKVAGTADLQAWTDAARAQAASFAPDAERMLAGLPRYRVVRSFKWPKGMAETSPMVFVVPERVERPSGDPGNALVLDTARGACLGHYCDGVVRLN
ncbi:MAG: hypothetical protein JF591_03820 [Lysobacter sp.]|nr:hypothetical protein [Lysobacter sp.]